MAIIIPNPHRFPETEQEIKVVLTPEEIALCYRDAERRDKSNWGNNTVLLNGDNRHNVIGLLAEMAFGKLVGQRPVTYDHAGGDGGIDNTVTFYHGKKAFTRTVQVKGVSKRARLMVTAGKTDAALYVLMRVYDDSCVAFQGWTVKADIESVTPTPNKVGAPTHMVPFHLLRKPQDLMAYLSPPVVEPPPPPPPAEPDQLALF